MKIIRIFLIFFILFFLSIGIIKADSAPPSKKTTFYFHENSEPVTQLVKFNIKCFGTSFLINSDSFSESGELLKISELSENCTSYGCSFDTSNIFEVYRKNIKYCDLEGEVGDSKFIINNFLEDDLKLLKCQRADFSIFTGDKYYKETPAYKNCHNSVLKEYYPSWDGDENSDLGNFICNQFLTEVPQNEHGDYCHKIINDICYKFTDETKTCIDEKDKKEEICNQYLEDVTEKIARDKNNHPFEEICEIDINIPINISDINSQEVINTEPIIQDQDLIEQPHKNIFIRIIDFFRCLFLKIFNKSC
jgi:hypothetical protein